MQLYFSTFTFGVFDHKLAPAVLEYVSFFKWDTFLFLFLSFWNFVLVLSLSLNLSNFFITHNLLAVTEGNVLNLTANVIESGPMPTP